MDRLRQSVQLALRERRRAVVLFGIWLLLTLICAVAGPFGTHDVLGIFGRLGYWAVVVGASILSSAIPFMARDLSGPVRFLIWCGYVLLISALVFGLNVIVFESWREQGLGLFVYLVGIVGMTALAVHLVLWLINFARPADIKPEVEPQAKFLRRLPLANRAPLVRIEAQDHYLNVVTLKGSALILLRLSEAVKELEGVAGLLVHRSHWVALAAVTAHRRDKGRDLLVMSDGTEVPVSRSNKSAAQDAGLF